MFLNDSDTYNILSSDWSIDPEKLGISRQRVLTCYNEYDTTKLYIKRRKSFNRQATVLCYLDGADNEQFLVHFISILNLLSSMKVLLFTKKEYVKLLSGYLNEHIHVVENGYDRTNYNINLIITFGSVAIHFIKESFPIIIAGPYGLGGWATKDNLPYLYKDCFRGRPGGTYGETIPAHILADEILAIKECSSLKEILVENNPILKRSR